MEAPSVKSLAIKWGLILGVVSIVMFLGIAMSGVQGESWAGWLGVVPSAIIIFLAHKEFKESGDGFMSYGKGLGIGTLTILVSSIISSVFSFVYIKFIDPTYFDVVRDKQIEGMAEGGMSDAEIETALGFSEAFFKPETLLITGVVFGVIFGFIISLIVSAITKNSNPALEV